MGDYDVRPEIDEVGSKKRPSRAGLEKTGGSWWESNPPGTGLGPHNGFEVREAHQIPASFPSKLILPPKHKASQGSDEGGGPRRILVVEHVGAGFALRQAPLVEVVQQERGRFTGEAGALLVNDYPQAARLLEH